MDSLTDANFPAQLEVLLRNATSRDPGEIFRGVPDDFWLWIQTEGRSESPALREMLPGLPPPDVQRRWTGKADAETLAEGFEIYRVMRDRYAANFGPLHSAGRVLDFGCGFGRVIRFFMKDVGHGDLSGTDYEESLVEFCLSSNPWCTFTRNEANPPLPFADGEVGFVYAYSVFSHFSEPMHRRWLDEFKRVLRPGGALILTVRQRRFIEYCERARSDATANAAPTIKRMFPDSGSSLAQYDAGEFCFCPYDSSDPSAWWGEACIPRSYIDEQWTELFDVVDFVPDSLKQHVVVLRA